MLDAAFNRCGVLRVNNIADIFYMVEVLAKQPRPAGPRLTVITNAAGTGVLATDALIGAGGELAKLPPSDYRRTRWLPPACLEPWKSVDILGDAGPDRYAQTLEAVMRNPESDGLLVIMTPQGMTRPDDHRRASRHVMR